MALGGATLFVVTILYRAPLELPLYTCCLVGAVGAVFFFSGFARYYRRHAALRMLRAQCATKLAALPAPRDILEKDYGDIIAALERNRLSAAADAAHREADATEYYTLWSHQIKTPLAAMRLLLQESPDIPGRSAFAQELFKAEQYVDMVLGYLRIGSIHADLSPQEVPLEALVRESVKKVSTLFIHQKSTTLQISSLPCTVLTDKKWLSFVLAHAPDRDDLHRLYRRDHSADPRPRRGGGSPRSHRDHDVLRDAGRCRQSAPGRILSSTALLSVFSLPV